MKIGLMLSAAALASLPGSPAPAQPAAPPWSADGQLEDSDSALEDGYRYDEHALRLEAGRRYRISAESDAFDTRIQLFRAGEGEPVAENDDFGESLNSRIAYTPGESGDYVLRVLAFGAAERGAYRASAETVAPLPPPSAGAPTSHATMRWHIWEGELAASDPDRDGNRFDDYLVPMRAGEARLISVESGAFDTMVWLLPADGREGEPIDLDDDSGTDLNAMLAFRAEADGDYIVRVTSFAAGSTGPYRLRISDPITPPPPAPLPMPDELDLSTD